MPLRRNACTITAGIPRSTNERPSVEVGESIVDSCICPGYRVSVDADDRIYDTRCESASISLRSPLHSVWNLPGLSMRS